MDLAILKKNPMMKLSQLLFLLLIVPVFSNGQVSEVFTTDEGAIRGYDLVSYFTENKPIKGVKEHSTVYLNVSWYFSSSDNLEKFRTDPEKYLPQFGGYCAYGMSRGYKAKTEPDAWSIVDGKLYLNYNMDVRKIWNENQSEFIRKANENWPTVKTTKFK
jgi:YHS domain-containing protein